MSREVSSVHQILCDGKAFAPSKVICVGKNFPDHVREMGGGAPPTEPVIFIKPNSSIVSSPREVDIPESLGLVHHEVELCALVGGRGKGLSEEAAARLIAGFAVGIDFTLRQMQSRAKEAGLPWALAKGFDQSAVLGGFIPADEVSDATSLDMSLKLGEVERQSGNTRDMIFHPAGIISYASRFMTIEAGDVIMCGTPAGVGEVTAGDRVCAAITGLPELDFIVRREGG